MWHRNTRYQLWGRISLSAAAWVSRLICSSWVSFVPHSPEPQRDEVHQGVPWTPEPPFASSGLRLELSNIVSRHRTHIQPAIADIGYQTATGFLLLIGVETAQHRPNPVCDRRDGSAATTPSWAVNLHCPIASFVRSGAQSPSPAGRTNPSSRSPGAVLHQQCRTSSPECELPFLSSSSRRAGHTPLFAPSRHPQAGTYMGLHVCLSLGGQAMASTGSPIDGTLETEPPSMAPWSRLTRASPGVAAGGFQSAPHPSRCPAFDSLA